jgi:Skp family chaperone for outer membrane proteins
MKKLIVTALLLSILGITNSVMAEQRVAVIDVRAVVNKSAQVQALKKEQQTKMKDLEKWLKTANADVEKQKTQEGKDKLLKK